MVENKLSQYVQKQLDNRDKTGLVNYLLYENGKIVINKKNYNDVIKKNKNLLRSNSMGKSLTSYVVGHSVCKGYIDSANVRLDDWIVLNDTLYADNTLLQVLNMTSGDQDYIGEKKFKSDGNFKDEKNKQSASATFEYGGQIHFSFKGMKDRVIFAMDGFAGQQIVIDMDNKRILIVNTISQYYNWNKIVYKVIKN